LDKILLFDSFIFGSKIMSNVKLLRDYFRTIFIKKTLNFEADILLKKEMIQLSVNLPPWKINLI
jgi:hypothetical protein